MKYAIFTWLGRVVAWCFVQAIYLGGIPEEQWHVEIFKNEHVSRIPSGMYMVVRVELKHIKPRVKGKTIMVRMPVFIPDGRQEE